MTVNVVLIALGLEAALVGIWVAVRWWMARSVRDRIPPRLFRPTTDHGSSLDAVNDFLHATGLPAARQALIREGHVPSIGETRTVVAAGSRTIKGATNERNSK